jgi:hypothetical protein
MIKHDVSAVSVVTRCTDCPHWAAFAFTRDEARRTAASHLESVHGIEPARANEPARKAATRRARHAAAL